MKAMRWHGTGGGSMPARSESPAPGRRQLVAGEHSHRRILLLSVAMLILFATSPVFGHHLALRADALLAGHDHLGNLCLIALHLLLAPVHTGFHVLLLAGLAYAVWDRARAWYALRKTLQALEAVVPAHDTPLAIAARRAGLPADRVNAIEGLPNPAFTTGFWRPSVYVAASLATSLDASQLEAVLRHEAAHVQRRDPLRLTMMRFLACTLFYIPALRRLAEDLTDEAEIAADDAALSSTEPLVLASAILALAEWAVPPSGAGTVRFAGAVGFQPFAPLARVDLLERRIRRLAGEPIPAGTHVTRRSLGGAAATLAAVWVSGLMMAHPLPAEGAELRAGLPHGHGTSHCRHHDAFALSHLFCFGVHQHASGAPCPHTGQ